MCGIFGVIKAKPSANAEIKKLANFSSRRGRDSSGLIIYTEAGYKVTKVDDKINRLLSRIDFSKSNVVLGHSRLITNGLLDNQPVVRENMAVIHNGIIVNEDEIWSRLSLSGINKTTGVDSEVILGICTDHLSKGEGIDTLPEKILAEAKGSISCAVIIPSRGKLLLFSNTGSLFWSSKNGDKYFASEEDFLRKIGCFEINQIKDASITIDIPQGDIVDIKSWQSRSENLIPSFKNIVAEEKLLIDPKPNLVRCSVCILPSTFPFISFDKNGKCNYCANYKPRNSPKPFSELEKLVDKYRKVSGTECLVPFSGGRDSSFGLHLIAKNLGLRAIAYTYDWGMVTDLGRRNISRMCSELGVENIVIAADISKKRANIAMNLRAWLRKPNLGMISILTAGDKHFFKYINDVKTETKTDLNIWSINPLEVTHFKSGFLGVKPDFVQQQVYINSSFKQILYQWKRFKAMCESPGYFNTSIWDTVSGEYYRSVDKKHDYYHLFDYVKWSESQIDKTLEQYGWERAIDTNSTWRIGDGTAAFYNYIYNTVAGFTEHDTFRSNQIREGELSRSDALEITLDENRPRYQNIRWYLDAVQLDYCETIKIINNINRLY
jgi:glucosamine--fructose-6-phosphate aminotransferase (isomerizing)